MFVLVPTKCPNLVANASFAQKYKFIIFFFFFSLLREILTSRSTNAERVVQGKLPNSQDLNLEEALEAKLATELGRMNSLIMNLGY